MNKRKNQGRQGRQGRQGGQRSDRHADHKDHKNDNQSDTLKDALLSIKVLRYLLIKIKCKKFPSWSKSFSGPSVIKYIGSLRETIHKSGLITQNVVNFHLRKHGICGLCHRTIHCCECKHKTAESNALQILEFLGGSLSTTNSCTIIALLRFPNIHECISTAIRNKGSNKLIAQMGQIGQIGQIIGKIVASLMENYCSTTMESSDFKDILKLLCKNGLTLESPIYDNHGLLYPYDNIDKLSSRKVDNFVLEALDIVPGYIQNSNVLCSACEAYKYNVKFIEKLILRSTDKAINSPYSSRYTKGRLPFFLLIQTIGDFRGRTNDTKREEEYIALVTMFLELAKEDGSGLDLTLKENHMYAYEYADHIFESKPWMYRAKFPQKIVSCIRDRTNYIQMQRAKYPRVLKAELNIVLYGIYDIVCLVESYFFQK